MIQLVVRTLCKPSKHTNSEARLWRKSSRVSPVFDRNRVTRASTKFENVIKASFYRQNLKNQSNRVYKNRNRVCVSEKTKCRRQDKEIVLKKCLKGIYKLVRQLGLKWDSGRQFSVRQTTVVLPKQCRGVFKTSVRQYNCLTERYKAEWV